VNDFRLGKDVRPSRYELRFELDLEAWTARGEETITLRLAQPARSLTLHSVDLEIATGDGIDRVRYDEEAQTATLDLGTELPAGEHRRHDPLDRQHRREAPRPLPLDPPR